MGNAQNDDEKLRRKLQKLLKIIKRLEASLSSERGAEDQRTKRKLMRAKRKVWKIEGVRQFDLDTDDLTKVILQLKRFGKVPEHYHYPELNRQLQ